MFLLEVLTLVLCAVLSRSVVSEAHPTPLSMGILQARILEWAAMPSSRGSSQPRDRTQVSYVSSTGRCVLYNRSYLGISNESTCLGTGSLNFCYGSDAVSFSFFTCRGGVPPTSLGWKTD